MKMTISHRIASFILYSRNRTGLLLSLAIALLVVTVACTSCTTTQPYWTGDKPDSDKFNIVKNSYATEKVGEKVKDLNRADNTHLTVLEFGKHGALAYPPQLVNIGNLIEGKSPAEILVYAHGWQNDASPGQGKKKDLGNFDSLVCWASQISGKPTLGIYIGWRGKSSNNPILTFFTLDCRRQVARDIGSGPALRGAMRQIISKARKANPDCRITFIGHSLGACLMEKLAYQMLCEDPAAISKTVPDLFLLMNNAETSAKSAPIIAAINSHPVIRAPLAGDRLLSPWVISLTSDGDWANRFLNPFNGLVHLRPGDSTPGFNKKLLTHTLTKNTESSWKPGEKDKVLLAAQDFFLEPAFFISRRDKKNKIVPVQFAIAPTGTRSDSVGYWNFRIPKEAVSDHNDIYNGNALGIALSMRQLAHRSVEPEELFTLPAGLAKLPPDSQKERLMKMRLPHHLKNILSLQRQSIEIRGEYIGDKDTTDRNNEIEEAHTNFGRQLWHGPALRIPYNDHTIGICLDALVSITGSDGIKTQEKSPTSDPRRRYGIRVFEILKYSFTEPQAWSKKNRARLVALLPEEAPLRYCVEAINGDEITTDAKSKFIAMVNQWLWESNVVRLRDNGK